MVTCWSTSHTCQYNGYDHWGRQVAMKMGMRKRGKKGREEEGKEGRGMMLEEKFNNGGRVGEWVPEGRRSTGGGEW